VLVFPASVCYLEKQNQWDRAVIYLVEDWRSNKSDLDKLLCAATEVWFVLVFFEQLKFSGMIRKSVLLDYLDELSEYAFEHCSDEFLFNLFFGYMIALFPYFFSISGEDEQEDSYDYKQQYGFSMCEEAYKLQPESSVAKLFCLGNGDDDDTFLEAARAASEEIERVFPDGGGAVVDYFRGILS